MNHAPLISSGLAGRPVQPWAARLKQPLVFSLVVFLLTGKLFAATTPESFAAANDLYAQGKFAAAAAAYSGILNSGMVSANLLFNYGNAAFKAGDPGKAIAAFRQALLLAPRDAEIRANLDYVRNQIPGATFHERHWIDSFGWLSLNEWTILLAVCFWLVLLLLTLRQWRPVLVPKTTKVLAFALLLFLASLAVVALQAAQHFNNAVAVVTTEGAVARSGPFTDAQDAFPTQEGSELSIVSRHNDWVQVSNGLGRVGWLNKNQVQIVPET